MTDLTVSMLGGQPAPRGCVMKTKAMETRDLMNWAHDLLHNLARAVPQRESLLGATTAMLEFFELCATSPPVIRDPALEQRFFDAALRFLLMGQRAGVDEVPKHHSFLHLADRTADVVYTIINGYGSF